MEVGGSNGKFRVPGSELRVASFLIAEFGMRIAEWKRKKTVASSPSSYFFNNLRNLRVVICGTT
jgi:hypothetical protein